MGLPAGDFVVLPSKVDTCNGAGLVEVTLDECVKAVPLLQKGALIHDPKGQDYGGGGWPKGCFQVLSKGEYYFNLGGTKGTIGGDGRRICKKKDVDECATSNGGCDNKRKCINTVGSMKCGNCATGYLNDGAKGCKALPAGDFVVLPSKVDTCTGAGLVEVTLDECVKECRFSKKALLFMIPRVNITAAAAGPKDVSKY